MKIRRRLTIFCWIALALVNCNSLSVASESPSESQESETRRQQGKEEANGRRAQAGTAETVSADPRKGMIRVPAGPFLYGATEEQVQLFIRLANYNYPGLAEETRQRFVVPVQTRSLAEFFIDEFEVTNAEYLEFVEATGYQPKDRTDYLKDWTGPESFPEWAATFPVVWVSQADAQAYCRFRGGRLPSEEQWEKAARGLEGNVFPWGDKVTPSDVANFSSPRAEPAGNRPADRSPFGIYDMGGNVSELTASTQTFKGRQQAVVRGGSFRNSIREMFTFQRDLSLTPTGRSEAVGFRCIALGGN